MHKTILSRNFVIQIIGLFFTICFTVGLISAQDSALVSGETIEGTLTKDDLIHHYTFSASEGARLSVTLTSPDFDGLLQIEDDEQSVIESNDDFGGSLNAKIDEFVINDDGEYTIVVTSSDGSEVGDYSLHFVQSRVQQLEYGESISGRIDTTVSEVLYQFDGKKGDVVSIHMVSNEIDSNLNLSSKLIGLASDDDRGGAYDALIGGYTLPNTDTYFITATTFMYQPDGEFTLTLDKVDLIPITINKTVTGTVSDKPIFYSFEGHSGEKISARVVSEDGLLDTILNIMGPSGYYVEYDDDSGYIYDPEINNMAIFEDGQYVVIVLPTAHLEEGEFELTLSVEEALVLQCDSKETLNYNDKVHQMLYQVDVDANQTVDLNIVSNRTDVPSLNVDFFLGGEYVSGITGTDETNNSFYATVTAPFTGIMRILVSDYSYQLRTYTMEVKCS